MNTMPASGFSELEHTADLSILVWADSIEELIHQAALGMYALVKPELEKNVETQEAVITLQAMDYESLIVAFLSELVFYLEERSLVFTEMSFWLSNKESNRQLCAKLKGREFGSFDVQIKAVTYADLEISRSELGYHTKIVFDI